MESPPVTDERLREREAKAIAAIQAGNEELFESLLEPYYETLFRVIETCVGPDGEVAKIMEETVNKAYERIDAFDTRNVFAHWLVTLAIEHATNHMDTGGNMPAPLAFDVASVQLSAIEQIRKKDLYALEGKLGKLPLKERLIYAMKMFASMRNHDIARCLSVTTKEVKTSIRTLKLFLLASKTRKEKAITDRIVNFINLLKQKFHVSH
jgi:DNA-directed RNA polymerase specialized sigma24 family protein